MRDISYLVGPLINSTFMRREGSGETGQIDRLA